MLDEARRTETHMLRPSIGLHNWIMYHTALPTKSTSRIRECQRGTYLFNGQIWLENVCPPQSTFQHGGSVAQYISYSPVVDTGRRALFLLR